MDTENEASGVQLSSLEGPPRRIQKRTRVDALSHLGKPQSKSDAEEFDQLIDDMLHISGKLDEHFLAMYAMVLRFENKKEMNDVGKNNITKLRKEMKLGRNLRGLWLKCNRNRRLLVLPNISSMFANTSFMEKYWLRKVSAEIMCPPHPHFNSLEWLTWISKLQELVSFLPGIILRCQTRGLEGPMFDKDRLASLKIKVAFFDSILDRAYEQKKAPPGIREPSIGFEINRQIKERTGISPEFHERTNESQRHSLHNHSQKGYATILALVSALTLLLAIIPGTLAMKYSKHERGTVQQADFWYLIQNSGMKMLSLLTLILSIRTRNDLTFESWFWTWALTLLAGASPVAVIPCYMYFPTEWSSLISFVGDASQGFVVLQSMFIVPDVKSKRE